MIAFLKGKLPLNELRPLSFTHSALQSAKTSYDVVANNPSSTQSELNAALAARLIAVAATVANRDNAVAAADAAKTNADADSWAGYDTAVNALVTVYRNAEAASDAQETHAVNAAYVVWANAVEAARSQFSTAVSNAEAQQTLADAQSENEAWLDVNAEVKAWDIADANEDNAYAGVLTGLEAAFITTVDPHWVTLANAVADADATQAVASAGAHAAAVGRWASTITNGSPLPAYVMAYEAAIVARTGVIAAANATYAHSANAAEGAWTTTVTPAWVTYEDEVTDHTATAETSIAGHWETFQNAIDDADLAYTTEAVPLWQDLVTDFDANFTAWVSDTADAEQTYSDELADNAVAWVEDVTAADEAWANATINHWTTYVDTATGLYVTQIQTINAALNNWAATVASQITGTPAPSASGAQSFGDEEPEWYTGSYNPWAWAGMRVIPNWIAGYEPYVPDVPIRRNVDADGLPLNGPMTAGSMGTFSGASYREAGRSAASHVSELDNRVVNEVALSTIIGATAAGQGDNVLDNLKSIEKAQERVRDGSDNGRRIIDSIEKSRQRLKNKLKNYDPDEWE